MSQKGVSTVHRLERNSRLVKPRNLCPFPMSEHPYQRHYWLHLTSKAPLDLDVSEILSNSMWAFLTLFWLFSPVLFYADWSWHVGWEFYLKSWRGLRWRMMSCNFLEKNSVVSTADSPSEDRLVPRCSKQPRNVSPVAGPSSCESSEACRTNLDVHLVMQAPKSKWVSKGGLKQVVLGLFPTPQAQAVQIYFHLNGNMMIT